MSKEEKEFEIKDGPLKGKKISMAPQDDTENFQYELEEILDVIGHPDALITDWSSIGDFFGSDDDDLAECQRRIAQAFGLDVPSAKERLVDLAKRVRKAHKG